MKFIYFLVTSSPAYKDKLDAMKTYFLNGGFSSALITAIVIAAVLCVLYYILCRVSFKWSKLSTWVITLIIAGGASFAVTGMNAVKKDALPRVIEKQYKKKIDGLTEAQIQPFQAEKEKIQRDIKKKGMFVAPVNRLCWMNCFYAMLFFYIFSIIINGISRNGVNIPHRGLIRP